MTTSMNTRREANRALWLILACGVLAWALTVASTFSDAALEAGHTPEQIADLNATGLVRASIYLTFAAIAVFTLGGLFGRRLASKTQEHTQHTDPLARAVQRFASVVIIIGLVLAAVAAVFIFLDNFGGGAVDDAVISRVLNSYLPIVLYTALVVVVILAAFVFTRTVKPRITGAEQAATTTATGEPVEEDSAMPATEPPADTGEQAGRRDTALAYTLPISAVAVALIFGLIVYDLTQTALEVWIWVIVQVLIAIGIVTGTVCAARAMRAQTRSGAKPYGVSIGAKNLNFVLSVIFAAVVASMAVGYGANAVDYLRVQPSLSLSVYAGVEVTGAQQFEPEDVTVSSYVYDVIRHSEAVVTLEPAGEVLVTEKADANGSVWIDEALPAKLEAGEFELTMKATAADGRELTAGLPLVVTQEGRVTFPAESFASVDDQPTRIAPLTAGWVFGDLAPALVLLLLVVATLHLTLNARNRE